MTALPPSSSPRWGILRAIGRGLAVILLSGTALALWGTLVPDGSATRRATDAAFGRFRRITGLEQHWDMFVSAPYHRGYAVVVEVSPPGAGAGSGAGAGTKSAGAPLKVGPVLPGLGEMPAYFRYRSFFSRLDGKDYAAWLAPYASRLGQELARSHPEWRGGSFRIRKTGDRLQRLAVIRDLGDPGYEETSFHGPFPIPAGETEPDRAGPR